MDHHNLIVFEGAPADKVYQAFHQWMKLYRKEIPKTYEFQILPDDHGRVFIKADDRLSNELFYFLFNYLKYPEGIEYNPALRGYTTGKDDNAFKGKDVMVYIPDDDTEYDNVSIVTSDDESFLLDFGWKLLEIETHRNYEAPPYVPIIENGDYNVQDNYDLDDDDHQVYTPLIKSPCKRLFILIGLSILSTLISWVVYYFNQDSKSLGLIHYFVGLGGAFVLVGDIELMNARKLYITAILFYMFYFFYGTFILDSFNFNSQEVGGFGFLITLIMLILQYPFRWIFVLLFGIEPEIQKEKSFLNGVYAAVVIVSSMLLSMKIVDFL